MLKNGVTTNYHQFTADEVKSLQELLGVRQDGTDYNTVVEGHGTGLAPPSEDEYAGLTDIAYSVTSYDTVKSYASSLDLSTSPSFPAVGDQLSLGACAAWAMTYYSYGYIEAVDMGWTSAKSGSTTQLLSPAFTYNRVSDYDHGSSLNGNAYVIRDWGCPTLSTMPYKATDYLSWGDDVVMRDAVQHRATGIMFISTYTVDNMKAVLQSGTPITFALDANQFTTAFTGDGTKKIVSAADYSSDILNHAQTVVGWDNTVSEDGDVGAFRVVNSWGTGFGESGYYWVTYNAMAEMASLSPPVYIQDKVGYSPSLTAVVHFDTLPSRDTTVSFVLMSNVTSSTIKTRSLYYRTTYSYGSVPKFPSYLFVDITEFESSYSSTNCKFGLKFTGGTTVGNVTSFRIEWYGDGYNVGNPTQKSGQPSGLPLPTSGTISFAFTKYTKMSLAEALDTSSVSFSSTGQASWTSIVDSYYYGSDSAQSGDVGDSHRSTLLATAVGPMSLSFYWRVSSESGVDYLRYSIDNVVQSSISGSTSWAKVTISIPSGTHVVNWTYVKSSSTSRGADCGYLDRIETTGGVADSTSPATSVSLSGTSGSNGWYLGSVTATLSATDSGSGVQATYYKLDSSAWATYSAPVAISTDGTHTLQYYSTDFSANTEATKSITVKKDSVAPVTSSSVTSYTVTLSRSDSTSGIDRTMYRIGSGAWTTYTSSFVAGSSGGSYLVEYYSVDSAGNVEGTKQVTVGNSDTTAPVSSVTLSGTHGSNSWYTTAVSATISATDSGSGVSAIYYSLDSSSWATYSSPLSVSTDGVHILQYYAVDNIGNGEATRSVTFNIDRSAPVTSAAVSGYAVTLSASDSTSGVTATYYRIGTGAWASYSTTFTAGISGSQYQVQYYSINNAGLTEETRTTIVGNLDATPPVTSTSLSGTVGNNGWYRSSVTIALSSSDAGGSGVSTIYYRWQGAASWTTYSSTFSDSTDGQRTLEYYAVDQVGNTESVKTMTISVDKTAPVSVSSTSGMTVSISATDAASGVNVVQYNLDGVGWTTYASAVNMGDPYHLHTMLFRAIDVAGNTESSHTLTLGMSDSTPPTTSFSLIGTLGSNGWYTSSTTVNLQGSDSGSGVYQTWYRVDSGSWTLYTGPFTVSVDGSHSIAYYSIDNTGNTGSTVTSTVKMDGSKPISSASYSNDIITITASDATSGIARTEYRLDGASYVTYSGQISISNPSISHSLVYRSLDKAGNIEDERTITLPARTDVDYDVPSAPSALAAELDGAALILSWQPPISNGNATILGYKLYRSAEGADFVLLADVPGIEFLDASTVLGITYSYYVTCYNFMGEGGASQTVSKVFVTLPGIPQNPSALVQGQSILVTWAAPSNDGGMEIQNYILTRTIGQEEVRVQISATSFQYLDSAVVEGSSYEYTIFAVNAMGQSPSGAKVVASMPYRMSEPSYLTATVTGNEVVLQWQAPNGSIPSHYLVRRAAGSDQSFALIGNVTELAFIDSTLTVGTSYRYQVCAVYGSAEGPSAITTAALSSSIPTAPTGLKAELVDGLVHLSWSNTGSDATGFHIFRSLEGDAAPKLLASTTDLQYTDITAYSGATYNYWVSAVNTAGDSPRCGPATIAVPISVEDVPSEPQSMQFQVYGDQITIAWTAPASSGTADIQGYRVYRSLENSTLALVGVIKGTQFLDEGLVPGMEYKYWVCAYTAKGEGARAGPVVIIRQADAQDDPTIPEAFTVGSYMGYVSLSWEAPEGEVIGYNIYCGNSTEDMELVAVLPSSIMTYVDSSVTSGKYYSIAAVYSYGEGVHSSAVFANGVSADAQVPSPSTPDLFAQIWFWCMMGLVGCALLGVGLIARRKR